MAFTVVPKIAANRSCFGTSDQSFVARVVWPEDYRIDASTMKPEPLRADESLTTLMTAEDGGAKSAFGTRLIWQSASAPPDSTSRRAVLAFMLNGAQSDNDVAHGGHFAVVTGWLPADGQWADWMVNNFYNLGSFSEKGIVASMLPMDNYLMGLNSGQSYYRPSYMRVAILKRPDTAAWYQSAIEHVFDRFYRHHIEYDHAKSHCAGLSLDALSGLGWPLPRLGATSHVKAVLGYFYSSATDSSFASGKRTFNYMAEERSRLYPRAAFERSGRTCWCWWAHPTARSRASSKCCTTMSRRSYSCAFRRFRPAAHSAPTPSRPSTSTWHACRRIGKTGRSSVDPRPFPDQLRDRPVEQQLFSDSAIGVLAVSALMIVLVAPTALWGRRAKARRAASR